MPTSKNSHKIALLEKGWVLWLKSVHGQVFIRNLNAEISQLKEYLKGNSLLYLGEPSVVIKFPLPDNYYKHFFIDTRRESKPDMVSLFDFLPFASESINCITAAFITELFKNPKLLFAEIDRVLMPNGYAIIIDVNPLGVWGILGFLGLLSNVKHVKKEFHLHASYFTQRYFLAKKYELILQKKLHFYPPVKSTKGLKSWSFIEVLNQFLPIYPPGFYVLIVKKFATQPISTFSPVFGTESVT